METKRLHRVLSAFVVPTLSTLAGCGSLSDDPAQPAPLATMNGTLSVASGAQAPASVRVALVWRSGAEDDVQQRFNVAEDLQVSPQFPARFELTLRNPPPTAALQSFDDELDMDAAVGSVVAYEDKNQNGKLDLVPAKATSFVDGIVGANDDLLVVWLPRELSAAVVDRLRDPHGGQPRAGYNLYKPRTVNCTVSPGSPAGGTPCDSGRGSQWLPIDAPFELPIVTDPKFNQLMCQSKAPSPAPDGVEPPAPAPPGNPSAPSAPQGPFPAAGAPGLTCSPDGRRFTYSGCREPGLCEAESACGLRVEDLPPDVAAPAGWPCTVH